MDVNAMFSVDQIEVPPELAPILRQYTKAVLRNEQSVNKAGLYKWTTNYFAGLGGMGKVFSDDGALIQSGAPSAAPGVATPVGESGAVQESSKADGTSEVLKNAFAKYANDAGRIEAGELGALASDLKGMSIDVSEAELLAVIDSNGDGAISWSEFEALFK